MDKVIEAILNGGNIRKVLWGEESSDKDIEAIKMELFQVGFLYNSKGYMQSKDTGFGGNKIFAFVSSLCDSKIPEEEHLRVEMSINSYPDQTEENEGFRFYCLIPRKHAKVCKAYLKRLLKRVRESNAYEYRLKPKYKDDGGDISLGVGVIVYNGDDILVGTRTDGQGLCGPGGCIKQGEDIMEAAIRETQEEFGIIPLDLQPIGKIDVKGHKPSYIFKTDTYDGEVKADDREMIEPRWVDIYDLRYGDDTLFEPFKKSLELIFS